MGIWGQVLCRVEETFVAEITYTAVTLYVTLPSCGRFPVPFRFHLFTFSTFRSSVRLRMHRVARIARASHVNLDNSRFLAAGRPIGTCLPNLLRTNWRHAPRLPINSVAFRVTRFSWSWKRQAQGREPQELPDNEEDAARAAILEKVMKGRQPADLSLRCKP